jgi:hypothetical protein
MKRFEHSMEAYSEELSIENFAYWENDGWEMCGCMFIPGLQSNIFIYYFKRELPEDEENKG